MPGKSGTGTGHNGTTGQHSTTPKSNGQESCSVPPKRQGSAPPLPYDPAGAQRLLEAIVGHPLPPYDERT